jgi:HlyD family secretion protein
MKASGIIKITVVIVATFIFMSCSTKESRFIEGKVKRESISLAPKVPGRILKINVIESDMVKAGDTLAILDVPEVEAKIQQAKGAYFAASSQHLMAVNGATEQDRQQVLAFYNAATEQYNFAEKSLKRVKAMYEDTLISAQAYDEVQAKYNAAKAQYEGAIAKKKEVFDGVRVEKISMAQGQMDQAQGALKEAQVAYSERYILAPADMTIETIALREGELALPGYSVFTGYKIHSSYFRFSIPESKISEFKRGMEYTIELPYIHKSMTAELVVIKELAKYAYRTSQYPNYQLGEAVYELKMNPKNKIEADSLYDNLTAIINY